MFLANAISAPLVIVIVALSLLFGIGIITYINPATKTNVDLSNTGATNVSCANKPVPCISDLDCKNSCNDFEEMSCQTMDRPANPKLKNKFGPHGKYCLPIKPEQPCDLANGGIWTYTGWSDNENMEWDCTCVYPQVAGGNGCQNLNPNICKGGVWDFNALISETGPTTDNCTCGADHIKITTDEGIPLCIPDKNPYNADDESFLCKDKEMCLSMYSMSS